MTEPERISDQLRRSYEGRAWHGPSILEVLAGVDSERAAQRLNADLHTIHELVAHLTAWAQVARDTLAGHPYVSLDGEADWPPPSGSWDEALARLDAGQRALIADAAQLDEARLDRLVSERKGYTMYILLHGFIQHNLYHAGQIALLKKLS